MGRDERDTRSQWQGGGRQADDLPDFRDDVGPARSPLEELRETPFLGDDDDLADERPATQRVQRTRRPSNRTINTELPLSGTALLGAIAFFAIGGLALIVVGLILGGFAGILLALVGLLSAACAGLAAWQTFIAGSPGRR
jgi:hypothetical protein